MKTYIKFLLMIFLLASIHTSIANDTSENTEQPSVSQESSKKLMGDIIIYGLLTGFNASLLGTFHESTPTGVSVALAGTTLLTGALTTYKCMKYMRQLK